MSMFCFTSAVVLNEKSRSPARLVRTGVTLYVGTSNQGGKQCVFFA